MRLGLGISGLVLLGIAVFSSADGLTAQQAALPGGASETGFHLFLISLAVLGLYFIGLARFTAPEAQRDHLLHFDDAPPLAGKLLLGILLLGLALRSYSLDTGIWFDEMLMHVGYMSLEPLEILTTYNDANNHILYTFLARLSIEAFGDTVWAIRVPAVVFGLGSIAAIYAFSRRIMSWREALMAAFLLTVSFHHIWFSQNARGYTALLFFSLVSSMYLIDAIRTGGKGRWLAYAVSAALGAFTHLTIGFLFIGHFLYFLFRAATSTRRDEGKAASFWVGMGFGFVPLGLLTIAAYAIVLPDILGGALLSTGLQDDSEWTNPIWAIRELVTSLQIGFSGSGVLLVGGFVVLVGMASFLRRDSAAVAFLVIPCGLAVLLMTSIGYTLFPRFFFFAMGFGVVIVIHGATVLGQVAARVLDLEPRKAALVALLPSLLLVAGSVLSLQHVYFPKQSYAQSIAYLEERLQPADTVAVIGVAELPYLTYYGKDWSHVGTAEEIETLLQRAPGRVWAIYTLPVQLHSAHPDIVALLESRFTTEMVFYSSLGGGEIVLSLSTDTPSADDRGLE